MYFIFLLFIIIIIISTILFLLIKHIDTFIFKNNNIDSDGNMTYNFISDKNNTKKVLNKYYLDDDIKSSNIRTNIHPYQNKNSRNLYGIPQHQIINSGKWGATHSTFSNYIYNYYGVRR